MALPVPSAFARRERLWPALSASLAVHALVVGWAVVRKPAPPLDLERKAIVAKLVRLGEKRPEQYLPRREAEPPPAPPAPAAAVPVPVAPAAAPRPAPSPQPAKAPPPPASGAPSAAGRPGGTSLASILSRVERETARERWGDPEGDPGGEAESGSEGDRYLGLVVQQLKRNYDLPKTIAPQDLANLRATVVLRIDANGRITSHDFERRSGNPSYDDALVRAIARTQLPPPPSELRAHYARVGLGVNFHL